MRESAALPHMHDDVRVARRGTLTSVRGEGRGRGRSRSMAEPLQQLIDKQALHELVLRYCRACDRRDFAQLRTLYHDDAIDDHGAMFCGTADEYLAWLPAVMANFEATVHSISNALFEVRGEAAQGELYTVAYHRTRPPAA